MKDKGSSGLNQSHPLKVGAIVEGLILPEPIRLVLVQRIGESIKIEGEGLHTRKHHQIVLTEEQVKELTISPVQEPFNGNAFKFRLGIEAYRLGLAYEYDPYFSLSIARVKPFPHQLEAVYDYMLPLPKIRFLLADDAGAGKTIMAGLLLKELKIRGLVSRILIITPANLLFQWQRELIDKFREPFEILRGYDLRSAYGTNPWTDKSQILTSMDWAKRDEVKNSILKADPWDLIIVDEAHKMSANDPRHKTERYRLGELLSLRTDHLLFLTATPHKGDPLNFCLFLQLLDRDVYGDVKSLQDAMRRNYAPFYLRRIKEALVNFPDPKTGIVTKIFTKRDVRTVRFELDDEEMDLYLALTRYVENQSMRVADDYTPRGRAIGFIMAMLQRRLASSVYAARRSLERMKDRLEKQLKTPKKTAFDIRRLEELDELPEDEVEKLVEEAEAAMLPEDRESIREQIAELKELIDKAKTLEEREVGTKLRKLHQILIRENIFKDPSTKLLIFTEHRDTLYYLVEKLQEWGLKVTQIHGGMKVGDRDTPGTRLYAEQEFRDKEGAQVMVATEAAGEGINLQFCWMMINYDIPWNPMRLEQRMGRIHRIGQEHDCLIFNFVATNTREGQVLDRLLTRLKRIRDELGTDRVFNVIGDIFPANQLERMMRDLYAGKTTMKALMERIVENVDTKRFKEIIDSALEGLAKKELNLSAILGKKELAKERRLVPEVVQQFFLEAAPIVGMHLLRKKKGLFRVGRVPRSLRQIGKRLEKRFGPLAKEYKWITFDSKFLTDDPSIEWVTPGHPLFEAVREQLLDQVRSDLQKGSIFYDIRSKEPTLLDVYAASVKDGRGRTLHRRLFVVEKTKDQQFYIRQPTIFLDLIPAPTRTSPPEMRPSSDKSEIESILYDKALMPFLREVRSERSKELRIIRRHIELSLNQLIHERNLALANLLERQQKGEELSGLIAQAENRLDELNERLERRRTELQREEQLMIGDITHIGRAWILPHPERTKYAPMVPDKKIEKIAMKEAMRYEYERGWKPEDVSEQNRGFDILSREPKTGIVRFIEVKGRAEVGEIILSKHEYETAERLKKDYWLYVVFNCATKPKLRLMQDPARLGWKPIIVIDHYSIAPNVIVKEGKEAEV